MRSLLVLLAAAALSNCTQSDNGAATSPWDYRVYVTNEVSGDVTIIDPGSQQPVGRIVLGKRPRGIVASPDKRQLFVALSGSPIGGPGVDESALPPADKAADGIAVVDVASHKVLRVLRGISDPEQVAVSPDGSQLYVASEDTGQLVVISASGGIRSKLVVGGEPEGVAVSPDGSTVLATSEEDHSVAVVDTKRPSVAAKIPVGQRPRNAAFLPSGDRAIVPGENDATISIIDVPQRRVLQTIKLPDEARPMGVAVSAGGDQAFVTTGRGGQLVRIDTARSKVTGTAMAGERPWGVALSPDGRYAFTANGPSNDVTMVDTKTMAVVARIKAGEKPWGVAAVPVP